MNRRRAYPQIASVGGKASHLFVRSRSDMTAALILEAGWRAPILIICTLLGQASA